MNNEHRKRNLESAFDKEVKRIKITKVNQQSNEAPTSTQRYHHPNENTTTFTFLPHHLSILQSLYLDQDDKSAVWDDIADFLSQRKSLLRKNSNCANLSELVQEATKVSNEASSMKYKTTSMNITEPRTNSNTSLSFITQSQQAQKLSLTSPFKSDIHDKALSSCSFPFQPISRETYHYQRQQQQQHYPIHLHGNYHRHSFGYNHQVTTSTIQSMNLVMALLRKQHKRTVDTLEKESQSFLPMIDMVRKEVQSLTYEINQLKSNHFESIGYNEKSDTTIDEVLFAAEKLDNDGNEEENWNELSALLCKRGLWKALGHSLEMVLFPKNAE